MAQTRYRSRRAKPSRATDIPVPSIPAGKGPFKVREAPPNFGGLSTNTLAKEDEHLLVVPLGQSPEDLAVRTHEYAHLELGKVRPTLAAELDKHVHDKKQPLDYQWLQAGLDVIVNSMAQTRGLKDEISNLPLDNPTDSSPDYVRAMWLLRKLSLTEGIVPKSNTLSKSETAKVLETYNELKYLGTGYTHNTDMGDVEFADYTAKYLRGLQSFYDTKEAIRKLKMTPSIAPMTNAMLRESMRGKGISKEALVRMLGVESPFDITHKGPKATYAYHDGEGSGWGTMDIQVMPMDSMAKRRAPERKPSYVGGFRNPVRALLPAMDGRAWAIRRKKMGGTILLDMSGSMSLDVNDIIKLLKTAPLAQIAGYSGSNRTGTLWIMAKGGRYHNGIPSHPNGNIVDGPALAWLAKQPKPRVWISDGQVTGPGDDMKSALLADAIGIVSRGDIERYHTIDAYLLGQVPEDGDTPYEE